MKQIIHSREDAQKLIGRKVKITSPAGSCSGHGLARDTLITLTFLQGYNTSNKSATYSADTPKGTMGVYSWEFELVPMTKE